LSIDWSIASKLITKGIPMALQLIVMIVSMVLMMTLVNRFGVNTAAAYGASMQVWSYVQIPAFALSMTVSAIAAQSIGAGKWDRVAATTRMGLLFGIGGTVLPFVLTQAFDRFALGLFLPAGSPALELAIHMNHIVSWSYMLFGLSLILFGVVRASGAVMAPLFILVCALLMVRFPFAELLMPSLGADAIWWSFPLAATLALLFATAYYKQGGWRTSRMMQLTDPPL
jgi:Na+-driven multidrug efflux pump